MKLVIVESPAKAKTIGKYLGADYKVDASKGHIWDLPENSMGIDFNNNYQPQLAPRKPEQKQTIERLRKEVEKADSVYLATDPDREGEAISYHLQCALNLDPNAKNRIMFNEISKKAVNDAIQNPKYVNIGLVNAQQARRVLDRLVGYTLSPVLCKKIRNKLSAGRVQSAALRIVVDREKEIQNFKPEEFWSVSAVLEKVGKKPSFKAALTEKKGKKFKIKNKEQCDEVLAALNSSPYTVQSVKKSVTQSRPQPPFTTSTLQQDAVNKLRMSSAMAMSVAQQLYEGFDITGMGHVALVTYIRTDSVRVSSDAISAARKRIAEVYGSKYVPETPNFFASKKQAQDAHEAIRPINVDITPEFIKDKVSKNQYSLYKLIYERFLASQAEKALYDSVNVSVSCGDYGLTVTGKTQIFDGYLAIYGEAKTKEKDKEEGGKRPFAAVGTGRRPQKNQTQLRTAFHQTACTFHRGKPHQGDGRTWHRASQHLRNGNADAVQERIRNKGKQSAGAQQVGYSGNGVPGTVFQRGGGRGFHRRNGRKAGLDRGKRRAVVQGGGQFLQTAHQKGGPCNARRKGVCGR